MATPAIQHRSQRDRKSSGGRRKSDHARCERFSLTCLPSDLRDLEVIADAWCVPISTLTWSVVHEWLARSRGVSTDLCDMRGVMRLQVEACLRDKELGPWLRSLIAENPHP